MPIKKKFFGSQRNIISINSTKDEAPKNLVFQLRSKRRMDDAKIRLPSAIISVSINDPENFEIEDVPLAPSELREFLGEKLYSSVRFQVNDVLEIRILTALLKMVRAQEIEIVYRNSYQDEIMAAAEVEMLANLLKKDGRIKVLELPNHQMGSAAAIALLDAVRSNSRAGGDRDLSLKELNLSNNMIGDEFVEALIHQDNAGIIKSLEAIDLSCNLFSETGLVALSAIFEGERSGIKTLIFGLNRDAFEEEGEIFESDVSLDPLFAALRTNRTLKYLEVSRNSIGPQQHGELLNFLRENCTLEVLDLKTNLIDADSAVEIFGALIANPNTVLKELYLAENDIMGVGMESLAQFLRVNRSLRILDISDNSINSGDLIRLAEALQQNNSLKELDIQRAKIDLNAANALAQMLKVNHSLTSLGMGVRFSSEGLIPLSEGLAVNNSLKSLNISENIIEEEHARIFANFLKSNTTLRDLDIGSWSEESEVLVVEAVFISNIVRRAMGSKEIELIGGLIEVLQERHEALVSEAREIIERRNMPAAAPRVRDVEELLPPARRQRLE